MSLERLRAAVDAVIEGQQRAKTGILLAILAREHAYLEGPPGSGKTLLAESIAALCGARYRVIRFHRDTREQELLGDALLYRASLEEGGGEQLSRRLVGGPFRDAEIVVLDDMSRAPGEALAPLLRILASREANGAALPLETAITTALPPGLELYADPLEPTQLDRFAVQVRIPGLLYAGDWTRARRVFDAATLEGAPIIDSAERQRLQSASAAVEVPERIRGLWLELLGHIQEIAEGTGSAITDRSLSQSGLSLLRAHACLRGADTADERDLEVVRYMLARRAPELRDADIAALLEFVVRPKEQEKTEESEGGAPRRTETADGEDDAPEAKASQAAGEGEDSDQRTGPKALRRPAARADVSVLLRALEGRFDRGGVDAEPDPGGVPRRIERLQRFDGFLDADPVETLLLAEGRLAEMPRALRRERYNRGGAVAVLRDVSASMDGDFAQWSGEVVAGIVRAGARRRMRVGYLEFNHEAKPFEVDGAFLHRRYGPLLATAQHARALGRTNYEAALRTALAEFEGQGGRNRHIVMLTDGVPVLGDPVVERERAEAKRLGVKIHTVFIGKGEAPRILDRLSLETHGVRFAAKPERGGRIALAERKAA